MSGAAQQSRIHLDTALMALRVGLSPLPPKDDGTKAPLADVLDEDTGLKTWKAYQTIPATEDHVREWYSNGRTGNGLACGYGDLECFEHENRDIYDAYFEVATEAGLGDLVDRIRTGYEEFSPAGGVHWLYRCSERRGNTKLAERPDPADPSKRETLIETRGIGGFIIIAPSNGRVHPSGGAYKLVCGGLKSIATISPDERDELWGLARLFNESAETIEAEPDPDPNPWIMTVTGTRSAFPKQGIRPGDDFTTKMGWGDILEPAGWTIVSTHGDVTYWRRPGKDRGISATTGHTKGFKVFTTSTSFDTKGTYTKLGAHALLHHQGDFKAAVKKLADDGYGTWIDDDGTELPNPVPKVWFEKQKKANQSQGQTRAGAAKLDLSWVSNDFATLADAAKELEDTAYAWDLWIPRGSITAVVSPPGIGKTRIVAEWCKRLWFKELMPDDVASPFPAFTKTLWLPYDRNWRGLVRSFTQFRVPMDAMILPTRRGKPLCLPDFDKPETMEILREIIKVHKPGWVVIDTTTYASAFNTGKPNEAKIAYDPIMDVLMDSGCACLGLTHTNNEGGVLNKRFLERCRVRIDISRPDPDCKERLRVEVTKSDDKIPPARGATFTDTAVVYDTKPPESPPAPKRGRKPTTSPGLAEFLWKYLQPRPAFVMDIVKAARDERLLKSPTTEEPVASISPLYYARDWVARQHPGKIVDEFEMPTTKGKMLKAWQIIDTPLSKQPGGTDEPPF
jgi:AAA domain/Bifunctional DNA primase/polymerase, N-terminal